MPLHHRLAARTALWGTTLLMLIALAVNAQGVDVTAICPGGDGSRPVKLAPTDSHTMEISCEESSETCRIKHAVSMNEDAGTILCVTANGAPYTVTVNEAVAMQTWDSWRNSVRGCSSMENVSSQPHSNTGATFRNEAVAQKWAKTMGSIATVSVCGNPDRDVVVCGPGTVGEAKTGAPQLCGDAGLYQAVYTGKDSGSTNGCVGSAVRLYFTIISVPDINEYKIYKLAFGEPVVTSVVNLNGTQQTVTGSDASDVSVHITVDTPNPLEGYFMATQGSSNPPVIGISRMQPDSCTGYCAFRQNSGSRDWLPMSTVCAGATPNCDASTTGFCEARVQLFTESSEDIVLPSSSPDGTVWYSRNELNYVVATTQGSAVPLKGTFVFNETVAERVTAKGAARDLSSAKIQVIPQDALHKDIVVVRAGGEVVAASSACKFALRSVRGTDRMYSVTNVLGEPTCDLVIGNGVEQRTFSVDTPAKASAARDVENVEPLWNEVLDEGGKKNLPLILGLSLGLGVGLLAVIAAVVVGLYCCRRRETCCFAEDSEHTDDATERHHHRPWYRCWSSERKVVEGGSEAAENPLETQPSSHAGGSKVSGVAPLTEKCAESGDSSILSFSAFDVEPVSPIKTRTTAPPASSSAAAPRNDLSAVRDAVKTVRDDSAEPSETVRDGYDTRILSFHPLPNPANNSRAVPVQRTLARRPIPAPPKQPQTPPPVVPAAAPTMALKDSPRAQPPRPPRPTTVPVKGPPQVPGQPKRDSDTSASTPPTRPASVILQAASFSSGRSAPFPTREEPTPSSATPVNSVGQGAGHDSAMPSFTQSWTPSREESSRPSPVEPPAARAAETVPRNQPTRSDTALLPAPPPIAPDSLPRVVPRPPTDPVVPKRISRSPGFMAGFLKWLRENPRSRRRSKRKKPSLDYLYHNSQEGFIVAPAPCVKHKVLGPAPPLPPQHGRDGSHKTATAPQRNTGDAFVETVDAFGTAGVRIGSRGNSSQYPGRSSLLEISFSSNTGVARSDRNNGDPNMSDYFNRPTHGSEVTYPGYGSNVVRKNERSFADYTNASFLNPPAQETGNTQEEEGELELATAPPTTDSDTTEYVT